MCFLRGEYLTRCKEKSRDCYAACSVFVMRRALRQQNEKYLR